MYGNFSGQYILLRGGIMDWNQKLRIAGLLCNKILVIWKNVERLY